MDRSERRAQGQAAGARVLKLERTRVPRFVDPYSNLGDAVLTQWVLDAAAQAARAARGALLGAEEPLALDLLCSDNHAALRCWWEQRMRLPEGHLQEAGERLRGDLALPLERERRKGKRKQR